MKIAELL